jgi:hypothetical protein
MHPNDSARRVREPIARHIREVQDLIDIGDFIAVLIDAVAARGDNGNINLIHQLASPPDPISRLKGDQDAVVIDLLKWIGSLDSPPVAVV